MILSHDDIEEIAAATISDFNEFFYKGGIPAMRTMPISTPIDQFASEYLKLHVSYTHLSSDGSFCGLTAYEDTEYTCEVDGVTRIIPLKRNQVLLDNSFIQPGQVRKFCGKRRFTLAHECAHQILFQLESDEGKAACRKRYSARRCYSLRDLKTREDWNEWQANVLGAAILMPKEEIDFAMWRFAPGRKLKNYNGWFPYMDRTALKLMCGVFGVSKTALIIRLRELGHLEDHPFSEFVDPLEILA